MSNKMSDYLFLTDQGTPSNRATIWLMFRKAAKAPGIEDFQVHHPSLGTRKTNSGRKKRQILGPLPFPVGDLVLFVFVRATADPLARTTTRPTTTTPHVVNERSRATKALPIFQTEETPTKTMSNNDNHTPGTRVRFLRAGRFEDGTIEHLMFAYGRVRSVFQ